MRRGLFKSIFVCSAALLFSGSASAYYYYVHFPTPNSTTAVVEKFDLSALTNNSVPFFISDQGPTALAPGDTFQAVIGEVRTAASVWNAVSTSVLRLTYGGMSGANATRNSPGIDVLFSDDIPPGLLALAGPSTQASATLADPKNGVPSFIPIIRSKLMFRSDLSKMPSFSELFFTTAVHEFGHTFGLQHTISSSVMSTAVTSGASKAKPLAADDIAGFSLLYPAAKYMAGTASIEGSVQFDDGTPVNLASVVAISTSNEPVSTYTNPDGTYRIDGIPPGSYTVYVQPLPPPLQGESTRANVAYPKDANGNPVPPSGYFDSQFYPGSKDWTQAPSLPLAKGTLLGGVDFTVSHRAAVEIHSIRTYGFVPNGVAVATPPLPVGVVRQTVILSGVGLLNNNALIPGLNIGVLGYAATMLPGSIRSYPPPNPYNYLALDFGVRFTSGPGTKHLIFNTADDLYVLPAAFRVVESAPPSVDTIDVYTNRVVAIRGASLSNDTGILFDGLPGTNGGFTGDGRLIVQAPPAPGGYTASVVAINPDGQSSLYLQGSNPSIYTYAPAPTRSMQVSTDTLTPGQDTQLEILGTNTNFQDGVTVVGFGTSDVKVKSVTVISPSHISVVVSAGANVNLSISGSISVTTGLEVISQSLGYQVQLPPPPPDPSS